MRLRVAVLAMLAMACGGAAAQGTKLWTVDRYDELERGSTEGVAIGSDGRLSATPPASLLYTTGGNYVWAVAGDAAGNAYVGTAGTVSGSASVMKVAPDGKAVKVFSGAELGVQTLRVAPDGTLYVGTSPDGKVYRVGKDGGAPSVVFDPGATAEKPKYLWDLALGASGEVYVAAGAPATLYRVRGGKTDLLFRSADQHLRCLLLSRSGMLWAGTDGGGVIYRIDPRVPGTKPFAMYAAAQREITALAEDDAGIVYAAGVGSKIGTTLPPLPVTGAVGVTITFSQPGSAGAVSGSSVIPEGSELYRIAPDGTPSRLLSLKEDVVYGLAVRDGFLLVGTGNRGRIYRVDLAPGMAGRFADVAHLEASQATALASLPAGGDLLLGTSNSGKVYRLPAGSPGSKPAVYTSEVFDAAGFARWGRAEVRSEGSVYGIFVRTGNVPSPVEGWSDWVKLDPSGAGNIAGGRYAQWKVELPPGGSVEQVALNYLPRNVPPAVDDVAVQLGARMPPGAVTPAPATVQVGFAPPIAASMASALAPSTTDPNAGPLTAQKDRTAATVRWLAHDDNGDDLMFSVLYRGTGEKEFRLLKDKISDRFYSFDLAALPDGPYVLKVIASDAPSHPDAETLTGERVSGVFVVDTTPPIVDGLRASLSRGPASASRQIAASFRAADATSPISHAEYSLDAGAWQYLEPQGTLSDGRSERYDFSISLPPGDASRGQHILAVRVYDRFDNVGSAKMAINP